MPPRADQPLAEGDGSPALPAPVFLGAGSMARAILTGLRDSGVALDGPIRATNRSESRAAQLRADGVEAWATESSPGANRTAVEGARLVVVAVKPAMVPDLLDEIASVLDPAALVVSVAAGVTLATLEAHLPEGVAVVRAMPNTPAGIGRGVTGLSAGRHAGSGAVAVATTLFETVGTVLTVPEAQIDALSSISGSGPAYVFLIIEKLLEAARAQGFDEEQAAALVLGTVAGSAELALRSPLPPAELRRQVTSPNGTTERALAVLDSAGLGELFTRATTAAITRAREIAAGD